MLNYNLNVHGGFTPVASVPPNAMTPEQVFHHYPKSAGAVRGTGTVPSVIVPVLCREGFSAETTEGCVFYSHEMVIVPVKRLPYNYPLFLRILPHRRLSPYHRDQEW